MPDGARKTALATQAFGRSGAELLPFLNRGRDGIKALREEAYEYGVVIDDSVVEAAERWEKQQKHLGAALTGFKNALGGALLKRVGDLTDRIAHWIAANRELLTGKILWFLDTTAQLLAPIVHILDDVIIKTGFWKDLLIGVAVVLGFANLPLLALIGALLVLEDIWGFFNGKNSLIAQLFPAEELEQVRAFMGQVKGFLKYIFSGQLGSDAFDGWDNVVQGMAKALGFEKGGGVAGEVAKGVIAAPGSFPALLPPAPAAAAGGAAPQISITQNIHAAPGMDEQQIADHSANKIHSVVQDIMGAAYSAVE